MLYYSATRSNFYSLVGLGNSRVKILGLPSSIPGSLCESACSCTINLVSRLSWNALVHTYFMHLQNTMRRFDVENFVGGFDV